MPIELPKASAKCIIREYQHGDIPRIAAIEFDPETKRYVGLPKGTKEDWIARASLDLLFGWVVIALPENKIAGRYV